MPEKKASPELDQHCDSAEQHDGGRKKHRRANAAQRHNRIKVTDIRYVENYKTLSMNNKLVINLRDLGHMIRFLIEGKGSQKRILTLLYKAGNMTQREMTEKLGIQPGSASEVIGKLESANLIQRSPSLTDRRTADIQLTPSGRTQAEDIIDQRRMIYREMFSCFTPEEQDTLLHLLERLHADWSSRYCKSDKGADSKDLDLQQLLGQNGEVLPR